MGSICCELLGCFCEFATTKRSVTCIQIGRAKLHDNFPFLCWCHILSVEAHREMRYKEGDFRQSLINQQFIKEKIFKALQTRISQILHWIKKWNQSKNPRSIKFSTLQFPKQIYHHLQPLKKTVENDVRIAPRFTNKLSFFNFQPFALFFFGWVTQLLINSSKSRIKCWKYCMQLVLAFICCKNLA